MPLLLIISVIISIYIFTLPGASAGIKYYLLPDFTKFSLKTVCAAMGQMFYSMSLAMGIMVTYGSYTKNETSLTKSVNQIEIFDTVVALLAGFMVVPAVYVFSGEAGTKASGAGLMFVTLPKVFEQIERWHDHRNFVLCACILSCVDQLHFDYGSYRIFLYGSIRYQP